MSDRLKQILSPISCHLDSVDGRIKQHLETGVPLIDDSAMHLFSAGGKKIRASLVLLAAGLNGEITDRAIDLAAAVEIIHAASLIHDDIIDKSFLRRGNIAVHSKYGDKVAVLAGDYLYSAAVKIAVTNSNSRILDSISRASLEMVKGELYQLEYSNIDRITEEHYFNIIERKTGRLMASSAYIGAIEGGLDEKDADSLYDMGLDLGYAFQIVDDTFDFSENSSITGKDVGNDFRDGKITLPFIFILNNGTEQNKKMLIDFAASPDEADWDSLKSMIHSSGSFKFSLEKARQFAQKAKKRIELFSDSDNKVILTELINFVVEREY